MHCLEEHKCADSLVAGGKVADSLIGQRLAWDVKADAVEGDQFRVRRPFVPVCELGLVYSGVFAGLVEHEPLGALLVLINVSPAVMGPAFVAVAGGLGDFGLVVVV